MITATDVTELFDLSASIDSNTAALQSRTCSHIIEMLQNVPGMILGDDVGMGKTYIAFGAAVWFLANHPDQKVVIITPSWLLNSKWHNDIRNFIEKNLHKSKLALSETDIVMVNPGADTYINQISDAAKKARVILIPINVFSSMGWKHEKSFFLACWFKHRRFWGTTRERILQALGGDTSIFSPEEYQNMGITYHDIPEAWYKELDTIYQEEGISTSGVSRIWAAIKVLRYKVINQVMPNASLLILDEAHKMKNEGTVKRTALRAAVFDKFRKGIFLTATPFELGEAELSSVLALFKSARISNSEMTVFDQVISDMFFEMKKYQEYMRKFEAFVHAMSPDECIQLENVIRSGETENLGFDVCETYHLYQTILEQKKKLENNMKKVMIRNVKKKNEYRKEIIGSLNNEDRLGIPLTNEAYIPFALMEKTIYQILEKGDRTFIANVKQSFTSSFEAVKNASIYTKDLEAMNMLRNLELDKIAHPKLNAVANEVVQALLQGEKTLLFCDRIETINKLKMSIENRLDRSYSGQIQRLFPENGMKGFENYSKRFYNKQDISWFLLQESYIHSVLMPVLRLCGKNKRIIPSPKEISEEVSNTYKKYNVTVKANYMYIKRIVEQIVFQKALDRVIGWQNVLMNDPELFQTVNHILDPLYIEYGINLVKNGEEEDLLDDEGTELRIISNRLINEVINYKGIWHIYHEQLNKLPAIEREGLVISMIHFLRRDKRFFIELRYAKEEHPDKDDIELIQRSFGKGKLLNWKNAYQRFLDKYCSETVANREELQLGLANSEVVATITGSTGNETRAKIKAGFNTPFYPQILIATATMQEGIDLQAECRRVFHYDLEWNPASLEQRVGRIDRLGSLIGKLREKDQEVTLDVFYPYIKNTIDESIYNTVKDREKWFNLILGGTPQWDTFEVDPDVTNIKPWVFKNLQIDLSVNS
jgi:superfamily II DNA or RNA helicase